MPLRGVLLRDPQGPFAIQAVLGTDQAILPEQLLAHVVRRWPLAVTFAEARRHHGGETQRQWSDRAIHRTPPVLLGLCSLVTLLAHPHRDAAPSVRHAAW